MGTPETIVLPEETAEVAALIERARVAQAAIADYTQEQVDELIRAMVGPAHNQVWPRNSRNKPSMKPSSATTTGNSQKYR